MAYNSEWSFRDELFAATQRWHLIVLFCLAGSLIGWLSTQLWPSPHRVTKELFVGLNVYQSGADMGAVYHSGLPFVNANDYKNWQMTSLNTLIYMDSVLDETLVRLRAIDPYWNEVDRDELAGMLHAYWRNAGKWRLAAVHSIPMYATQAVLLWQDVVVEQVHRSVAEAQNALEVNHQLAAMAEAQAAVNERVAALNRAQGHLVEWQTGLDARPETGILDEIERAQLWAAAAPAFENRADNPVVEAYPPAGSAVTDYITWIGAAKADMSEQLAGIHEQSQALSVQYNELTVQYSQAIEASLGISAELLVQKVSDRRLEATELRPIGPAILIGALLGFIAWAMVWLVRPAALVRRELRTSA